MKKSPITTILRSISKFAGKHGSEILTALGISMMAGATVMGISATPKAIDKIKAKKEELQTDDLTVTETVKASWICYIPTVLAATAGASCLIMASRANLKRCAALATAYNIAADGLKDYQRKIIDIDGLEKHNRIMDEIVSDKANSTLPVSKEVIISADAADVLCYDSISGRYFTSTINKLDKAINSLNRELMDSMYISVNEFYDAIGLPNTRLGDELGWNIDHGMIELRYSTQLSEDDRPAIVIGYSVTPKYDYSEF